MQTAKARRQLLDEINITPLTDVFLVLLIIMMVVAPLLHLTRTEIRPPQVNAGTAINEAKLVVEVTREGVYFVDGTLTPAANLAAALAQNADRFAARDVVIRADRSTRAGAVLKVFDAAHEAQFQKVTVIVETLTPERLKRLEEMSVPEVPVDKSNAEPDPRNPDETTKNVQ